MKTLLIDFMLLIVAAALIHSGINAPHSIGKYAQLIIGCGSATLIIFATARNLVKGK